MKRYRILHNSGIGIFSVAFCLLLAAALAFAQETTEPEPAEASKAETAETAKPAPEAKTPEAAEKAPDKVALNLNKVNIDKLVKFLSELTGKTVMKHKNAKAEITIVSHEEVPRQEAIRMICEALRLEKVAVVDRDNIIWLIPQDLLPLMDIEFVLPTEELPKIGVITKAIPVKFIDVKELEKLIRPLLSEKATLIAYPAAKKIIVTDSVQRIANLERVMAELDVLDVDDRQVRIFQLKYADAEELAPILKALMGAPGKAPSGKPTPKPKPAKGKPGAPAVGGEVEILPYKAANWLLVVAPKEKLAQIARLIDQLDQEMPQELRVWVIPVKYAAADELAKEISTLLKKRYQKRLRDTIEITSDSRSNSLMVLCSEPNYNTILVVVEELDTEESLQMKTEWFELKHADAEDLAEQLNDLYSGLEEEEYPWYYWRPRRAKPKTRFVAERRTNSLIAIAPPTEFEKIRALVERLDQPIDIEQVAPRVFLIKYSDAKELTEVLNRVFGVEETGKVGGYYDYMRLRYGGKTEVGRLYGKVRFDPLPSINAIIVTTNNKENFPLIEKFIRELDRTAPEAANLLVVTLNNARAGEVAKQLNILFSREGVRAPEKKEEEEGDGWYAWFYGAPKKKEERPISNLIGQVRVVEDKRTNSLLITTAVQNHAAIKALIRELDAPEPKVFVAVRLIEIIRSKSKRMGVRFSSEPTVFETDDFDNGLRSTFGFSWEEVHGNGVVSADINISTLVQFITRRFDTRILSDTTLTMENNEEAEMFVGAEIPFIEKSQITPEGTRADSFTYKAAGTTLRITPNINQKGKVVMSIFLEASQRREGEVILGGAILDTRRFNTTLAVEDGQTIVMGGIMREQEVEGIRGVPILKDIPLIRLMFSKKDTRQETTELVAFITPTVLWTRAEDEATTRKFTERLREEHDWQSLPENVKEEQGLEESE